MRTLSFDIETVPQDNLSKTQEEWLEKRLQQAQERSTLRESTGSLRRRIMSTSPYLGKIICIGVGEAYGNSIHTKSFIGDEANILSQFWLLLRNIGQCTFVSFNGLKFDTNFIIVRSLHHGIFPSNKSFLSTMKYRKFPHFDVMQWISDWGYPSPSLDLVCDLLGIQSSKAGKIQADTVEQAYEAGQINEIAEYCESDARVTLEIYLKLKHYIRD
jgi:predicted PolB exonuclease-like 3'-5' exonuclease